jgi:hypothetical protein
MRSKTTMADKAPYKLTVKFNGGRPEQIAEALTQLRSTAGDYDLTGESTATMTIESWQEAPLRATMDDFEVWLYHHHPGLVDNQGMLLARPGLRPETAEMLAREKRRTPMDAAGWVAKQEQAADELERDLSAADEEAEVDEETRGPIIIHPPLQLPPGQRSVPLLGVVDGEYTIDEEPISSDGPPRR